MNLSIEEKTHTFELSGLGVAPFTIIDPRHHAIEKSGVFFCQHCGTIIKNQHFIKSSDNQISVVGIDCLKKTGDHGLIAGEKRIRQETRRLERENVRTAKLKALHAQERELNDGLTNWELIQEKRAEVDSQITRFIDFIEDHPIIELLSDIGFEGDMKNHAFQVVPFSKGQLNAVLKIATKKLSGSRVNSKAYQAHLPKVSPLVDELQSLIVAKSEEIETIQQTIRDIHQR